MNDMDALIKANREISIAIDALKIIDYTQMKGHYGWFVKNGIKLLNRVLRYTNILLQVLEYELPPSASKE